MRKTKIICTIGPASEDLDIIMQMMEAWYECGPPELLAWYS